ncbi:MAG: hypothetical protein UHM85_09665 [Acutalibacteraceae bacterium]|nr:hypothetical protein [Acutalibacteraceae bacterium]
MSHYCLSRIRAFATESEWKEIVVTLRDKCIEWSPDTYISDFKSDSQEIHCEDAWEARPLEDGYMLALSKLYPSVIFRYNAIYEADEDPVLTWFCNSEETKKESAEKIRTQAYKNAVERFITSSSVAAEGVHHRVEIMPDGRVDADGENIFGECNIYSWKNIKAISCGNNHTVGLTENGDLIACGSNANGQCNISNLPEKAVAVSCGRYHTAVLLNSGKVLVRGKLEEEASLNEKEKDLPQTLDSSHFPIITDLRLNKYIEGWEEMNEEAEHMSPGDELSLKEMKKGDKIFFEVFNADNKKIGRLYSEKSDSLLKIMKSLKASVNTIIPLSQRNTRARYADVTIRLDYISPIELQRAISGESNRTGTVIRAPIADWPVVTKIKSIYDSVIGVTAEGEILIDGYCPCTEKEIQKIFEL